MKAEKAGLSGRLSSRSLIFDEPSSLRVYSFDQGEVLPSLKKLLLPDAGPDVAVQPGSLEDLVSCIRYGLDSGIPLVPRGASTNGMGGAVPHHGGILLDFSPRREIYEFDAKAQWIRVGAGCRWADVSNYLEGLGFDLCTYPTSWFSTVGGWASTGGCGIGCTQYGNFHDLIHAITVVTPSGEVRHVSKSDPEFGCYVGTEGQMGAIWDVTFEVRRKPARQIPLLVLFDSPDAALACAQELLADFHPYHMKFLDSLRIHEINHLLREEHRDLKASLQLPEKETLLVCFEDQAAADSFRQWASKKALFVLSDFKAHLLWRERMFPLRVRRIAPGLLASEVVLPNDRVAAYAKRAAHLGDRFHVRIATECYFLNDGTALTLPVFTFRGNGPVDETLKSSLAVVLTQLGVRMGGRPYGIGIWNTPFLKHKFGQRTGVLRAFKAKFDPQFLFNPGKFFDLKFRCGFPGMLAAMPLNSWLIPIWTRINPFLARLLTGGGGAAPPADLILLNEELCSKCGSCIPVCPAYIETNDERTTARGKLHLGKTLSGGKLSVEEAQSLFLCMHCAACTDVCQSRLDLVPVWDELERRVEAQFGKDVPNVRKFVEAVEKKKIMEVPYARGAQVLVDRKSE
jgi:FAD/FMN-containing dehydrogenase/ferredoxin